eukprot:m.253075 g.253075  ORF g.253075 m.253075 type:complete len:1168 (-) comp17530_c0_seq4:2163-5666(-)
MTSAIIMLWKFSFPLFVGVLSATTLASLPCASVDVVIVLDTASGINSSAFTTMLEELAALDSLLNDTAHRLALITTRPAHVAVDWQAVGSNTSALFATLQRIEQFKSGLRLSPALDLVSNYLLSDDNPAWGNNSRLHLLLLLNGPMSDSVTANDRLKAIQSQHGDVVITAYAAVDTVRLQAQLLTSQRSTDQAWVSMPTAISLSQRVRASANCISQLNPCAYNLLEPLSGSNPLVFNGTVMFTGQTHLNVITQLPSLASPFSLSFDLTLPAATSGYLIAKMTQSGTRYWSVYLSTETRQLTWFYQTLDGSGRSIHAPANLLLDGQPHRLELKAHQANLTIQIDETTVLESSVQGQLKDCKMGVDKDCLLWLGQRSSTAGPIFGLAFNATMAVFTQCSSITNNISATGAAANITTTTTQAPTVPQLVKGSCINRCLTGLIAGGECFCDEACHLVGDCCSDFNQLCVATTTTRSTTISPTTSRPSRSTTAPTSSSAALVTTTAVDNSCQGRCAIGISRDLSCYCESSCRQAKDCCADAEDLCLEPTTTLSTSSHSTTISVVTSTTTASTTPPPCVERQNHCHTCTNNRCSQCRDQHYLFNGFCLSTCPEGFTNRGIGNFNRDCVAATTTTAPTTVSCAPGVASCVFCTATGAECLVCADERYLHNGQCLVACPTGYVADGTGFYSRKCLLPPSFVSPSDYTLMYQGRTVHNTHQGAAYLRFTTALDSTAQVFSSELSLELCALLCSSLPSCLGLFIWTKDHNQEQWCAGLSDLGRDGGTSTNLDSYSLTKSAPLTSTTTAPTTTSAPTTPSALTSASTTSTPVVTTSSLATSTTMTTTTAGATTILCTSGCDRCNPNGDCLQCLHPLLLSNGVCVTLCPPKTTIAVVSHVLQCSPTTLPSPSPPPSLPIPKSYQCIAGKTSFDGSPCRCRDPNCLLCLIDTAFATGSKCLVCTNSYYLIALGQCTITCSLNVPDQTAPNGRKCIAQAPPTSPPVGPTLVDFCTNGRQANGEACQCLTNCLSCVIMSDGARPCQTCSGFALLHMSSCVSECPEQTEAGLSLRTVQRMDGIGGLCQPIVPTTTTPKPTSSPPSTTVATNPECYGRTLLGGNSTKACTCGGSCYWCQVDDRGANVRCLECYNSTYLFQGACVSHCNSGLEPTGDNDRGRVCS